MTFYHFHTSVNGQRIPHDVAIPLESDAAAWTEARTAFGEFVREVEGGLAIGSECIMIVLVDGAEIFEIRLTSRRLG